VKHLAKGVWPNLKTLNISRRSVNIYINDVELSGYTVIQEGDWHLDWLSTFNSEMKGTWISMFNRSKNNFSDAPICMLMLSTTRSKTLKIKMYIQNKEIDGDIGEGLKRRIGIKS
jgi:hypothetical protein